MNILSIDNNIDKIIDTAINVLNDKGLIIYPTETCYGVGVKANDPDAVSKLLKYKRRPEGKPVLVAVSDIDMARRYVDINETATELYNRFLPGPVAIVSRSRHILDKRLESEDGTLGVRMPKYDLILRLIKKLNVPITSTSANSSGKKTPYLIKDVIDNLSLKQINSIDLLIDAHELAHNPPSTVIDTTKDELKVLRKGSFSLGKLILDQIVNNEEDMRDLGEKIIKRYDSDDPIIFMFNADLGAGKTQFIKGMAKGSGVKGIVNSPTFVIMKEYDTNKGKLIHLDAWRLESIEELKQLKIEELLIPNNIVAVEWAGMARDYLSSINTKGLIKIYIEIEYISFNSRRVKIYEE